MSIADNRQRFMPLPDDRIPPRGQVLAYPEAVRLVDPVEPEFKGEVCFWFIYHQTYKIVKIRSFRYLISFSVTY